MTAPTSPKPHTPADLIETAARALDPGAWLERPSLPAPMRDRVEARRSAARYSASCVLSAVAGPLRAEAWERGRSDGYHDALRWNDPARCVCDWTPTPNPFEES